MTLKLYGVDGREVRTIYSDRGFEPGRYFARLEGGGLPSGVYFVRMVARPAAGPEFRSSRKLVVVR